MMVAQGAGELVLTAWVRPCSEQGKRRARRLRRQGFIPAVLYGLEVANGSLPIKLAQKELQSLTSQAVRVGTPVRLRVHGEAGEVTEHVAVIQEAQRHPLELTLQHLDFFAPGQKTRAPEAALAAAASSQG